MPSRIASSRNPKFLPLTSLKKWFLLLVLAATVFTIFFLLVVSSVPPRRTSKGRKLIIGWTRPFTEWTWLRRMGLDTCEHRPCEFTTNRSRIHEATAVLFCCGEMNWRDIPAWRAPSQLYILVIFESAQNTYVNYGDLASGNLSRNFFNWTQSYRRDSTVYMPYGLFTKRGKSIDIEKSNRIEKSTEIEKSIDADRSKSNQTAVKKKTKMIAQFVSNCDTWSRRELIVDELKKSVEVDVYGVCGKLKCHCPLTDNWCPHCAAVLSEYRFYLAFENSVCRDYVTEKFFAKLEVRIVPIVLYGRNYAPIAPPHSYIAIDEFASLRALTEYLKYLAKNATAYEEYFVWREEYEIVSYRLLKNALCPLCEKLLQVDEDAERAYSTVENAYKWWVEEGGCVDRFGDKYRGRL